MTAAVQPPAKNHQQEVFMKNRQLVYFRRFRPPGRPRHRTGLRHQEVRPDRVGHTRPEDRRGLDRGRGQPEADQGTRRPAGDDRLAHHPARRPVQGGRRQDRGGQDPHPRQPRHDGHAQEQRRQVRLRQRRAQPRGEEHPRRSSSRSSSPRTRASTSRSRATPTTPAPTRSTWPSARSGPKRS